MKEIIQKMVNRKFIGLREHMKRYSPKMIFKSHFFFIFFAHLSPSLMNTSTAKFTWNEQDKTPNFNDITPCNYFEHVGGYQDISGQYGR